MFDIFGMQSAVRYSISKHVKSLTHCQLDGSLYIFSVIRQINGFRFV